MDYGLGTMTATTVDPFSEVAQCASLDIGVGLTKARVSFVSCMLTCSVSNMRGSLPSDFCVFSIYSIHEQSHGKRVLITEATSKGSDKSAHKRSLARAFAFCRHIVDIEKASGKIRMSVA